MGASSLTRELVFKEFLQLGQLGRTGDFGRRDDLADTGDFLEHIWLDGPSWRTAMPQPTQIPNNFNSSSRHQYELLTVTVVALRFTPRSLCL